jgi:Zn-dependent peptidase ImmA (M78 family)
MGLPVNFIDSIPRIERILRYTQAHKNIKYPVNIDKILEDLIIDLEVKPFSEDWIEGYCMPGNSKGIGRKIFINANKPVEVRRKAKAHELHHLIEHGVSLPLFSRSDQVDRILEREANFAAAYYLVPGKCIAYCQEWNLSFQDLAEQLYVPVDLVMKRYDIYLKMKEHRKLKNSLQLPFDFDL